MADLQRYIQLLQELIVFCRQFTGGITPADLRSKLNDLRLELDGTLPPTLRRLYDLCGDPRHKLIAPITALEALERTLRLVEDARDNRPAA